MENDKEHCGHGHRQRLRDRYAKGGISALSDYEVVEYMLMMLIPRVDVKPVAKDLIKKYKSLRAITEAPTEELIKTDGLGKSAATSLAFIKDCVSLINRTELEIAQESIDTISNLIKYFRSKIGSERGEVLEMVCFDTQLRIIPDGAVRLFEGSVNSVNVDIRKIIEIAIKLGASSIAIAHNHPSGETKPSFEDVRFTRKISEACKPISLNFIEHVIVGRKTCFSFRRDGRFEDLHDDSLDESRLRGRMKQAEEDE